MCQQKGQLDCDCHPLGMLDRDQRTIITVLSPKESRNNQSNSTNCQKCDSAPFDQTVNFDNKHQQQFEKARISQNTLNRLQTHDRCKHKSSRSYSRSSKYLVDRHNSHCNSHSSHWLRPMCRITHRKTQFSVLRELAWMRARARSLVHS